MSKRRRRSFTPQFKAQVVLQVLAGLKSQAEVARQHKLKPELINRWKDIALEGLESLFQGEDRRGQDQDRIAELERMVGRLTMELEVAKKLGWQTSLELARILSYRLAPPSQSTQITGKTVVRMAVPVKFAILEKKPRPCCPRRDPARLHG